MLLEIGVGQLDHVAATAGFRRATSTFTSAQALVGQLFGLLQTGIDETAGRTLSVEVGRTGFRGAEQLDGWEAFWSVGREKNRLELHSEIIARVATGQIEFELKSLSPLMLY